MKKAILPLIVLTTLLASCGQQQSTQSPSNDTGVEKIDTSSFKAEDGWTNPYPGVYLKTVTDSKGSILSEEYATTSVSALKWLAERNKSEIEKLKSNITPLSLEGDTQIRLSQRVRALNGPIEQYKSTEQSQNNSSNLTAQATCIAEGYAKGTSPTPGAKAYARVGNCTNNWWSVTAQATNDKGESPIFSRNYGPTNITTVSESPIAVVYGAHNCYSEYQARSGTLNRGLSQYSCYPL